MSLQVGSKDCYFDPAVSLPICSEHLLFTASRGEEAEFIRTIKQMDDYEICVSTPDNKYTILHLAVHSNSLGIINYLVNKTPEIVTHLVGRVDIHGQTALHWAAGDPAKFDICKALINTMEPNQIRLQMYGRLQTALHFAVHSGSGEMVGLFTDKENLPKGDSLFGIVDQNDQSPLHWVAGAGNFDMCLALHSKMLPGQIKLQNDRGYTALHLAVQSGKDQIVELLVKDLEAGDELLGVVDQHGQTALHWAASSGREQMCQNLCAKMTAGQIGIQMNDRLQTALHFAAQGAHQMVIEIILDHLSSRPDLVKLGDKFGQPAFVWAKNFIHDQGLLDCMDPSKLV